MKLGLGIKDFDHCFQEVKSKPVRALLENPRKTLTPPIGCKIKVLVALDVGPEAAPHCLVRRGAMNVLKILGDVFTPLAAIAGVAGTLFGLFRIFAAPAAAAIGAGICVIAISTYVIVGTDPTSNTIRETIRGSNSSLFSSDNVSPVVSEQPLPPAAPRPPVETPPPNITPSAEAVEPIDGSRWSHNGSIVYLRVAASSRKIFYETPRAGMLSVGAAPNALLFEGTETDATWQGKAYIFNKMCGKIPYDVIGKLSEDGNTLVLRGLAPKVDQSCNISSYGSSHNDILFFEQIK